MYSSPTITFVPLPIMAVAFRPTSFRASPRHRSAPSVPFQQSSASSWVSVKSFATTANAVGERGSVQSNLVPAWLNRWKLENCLSSSLRLYWSVATLGFVCSERSASDHATAFLAFLAAAHLSGRSVRTFCPSVLTSTYAGNSLSTIAQSSGGHLPLTSFEHTRSRTRTKYSARL